MPFRARDGFELNLINVRGARRARARARSCSCTAPGCARTSSARRVRDTIVDALVDAGYDVWLENWRAQHRHRAERSGRSTRPRSSTTRPRSKTVVDETGADRGEGDHPLPGLDELHDVGGRRARARGRHDRRERRLAAPGRAAWSRLKIGVALPLVEAASDYLNPQWGDQRADVAAEAPHDGSCRLTHHECDNAVCKQVSFTYGIRLSRRSGATRTSTTRRTSGCRRVRARADHVLRADGARASPRAPGLGRGPPRAAARLHRAAAADRGAVRVLRGRARTTASCPRARSGRFGVSTGPRPGCHALHVLPGYSHLDVFMGKNAARDVFPLMLEELERQPRKRRKGGDEWDDVPRDDVRAGCVGETDPEDGAAQLGTRPSSRSTARSRSTTSTASSTIRSTQARSPGPSTTRRSAAGSPSSTASSTCSRPVGRGRRSWSTASASDHGGTAYYLAGKKHVHDDPGFDVWKDTTTLYTVVHEGEDESGPVGGAGVLGLGVEALARKMSTMRPTRGGLEPMVKFGRGLPRLALGGLRRRQAGAGLGVTSTESPDRGSGELAAPRSSSPAGAAASRAPTTSSNRPGRGRSSPGCARPSSGRRATTYSSGTSETRRTSNEALGRGPAAKRGAPEISRSTAATSASSFSCLHRGRHRRGRRIRSTRSCPACSSRPAPTRLPRRDAAT